ILVRQGENGIHHPPSKRLIVAEVFKKLGFVAHSRNGGSPSGFIVFDTCILWIRILLGILICDVGSDRGGELFGDQATDAVAILPLDVPKLLVERLQYV